MGSLSNLNIAVRVRMVVMPMPTLPGTEERGRKRPSQASSTKIEDGMYVWGTFQRTISYS